MKEHKSGRITVGRQQRNLQKEQITQKRVLLECLENEERFNDKDNKYK